MVKRHEADGRYHCRACDIWLADNKAQRLQHERGAKHRSAAAALIEGIAKRNREAQAANPAASRQAAVCGTLLPEQHELVSLCAEKAASAVRVQGALTVSPHPAVDQSELGRQVEAQDSGRDMNGYGRWEEIADADTALELSADNANATLPGLKRRAPADVTIGALDSEDDDEAASRHQSASGAKPSETNSSGALKNDSGPAHVAFKRAHNTSKKRRRKNPT